MHGASIRKRALKTVFSQRTADTQAYNRKTSKFNI